MKQIIIDGVTVNAQDDIPDKELRAYVNLERKHYATMTSMDVTLDGDFAEIAVHTENRPFERLRRITGYLVGTMERWNDGKRAEERDRVKHSLDASNN